MGRFFFLIGPFIGYQRLCFLVLFSIGPSWVRAHSVGISGFLFFSSLVQIGHQRGSGCSEALSPFLSSSPSFSIFVISFFLDHHFRIRFYLHYLSCESFWHSFSLPRLISEICTAAR